MVLKKETPISADKVSSSDKNPNPTLTRSLSNEIMVNSKLLSIKTCQQYSIKIHNLEMI